MHQFRLMHDFLDLVRPKEQKKTGTKGLEEHTLISVPFLYAHHQAEYFTWLNHQIPFLSHLLS
jgi:hypothetical protein